MRDERGSPLGMNEDARDRRLSELMLDLLSDPHPDEPREARVQRTRDLVAEMEILAPGALDRLQAVSATIQLRRLQRQGGRPN